MGAMHQRKSSTALTQKKALKIITNSHYIARSEPIFKAVRCLKITDMFSVAIWKFYFKLMNNKLPNCFSSYKPVLPVGLVSERYEILNLEVQLPSSITHLLSNL